MSQIHPLLLQLLQQRLMQSKENPLGNGHPPYDPSGTGSNGFPVGGRGGGFGGYGEPDTRPPYDPEAGDLVPYPGDEAGELLYPGGSQNMSPRGQPGMNRMGMSPRQLLLQLRMNVGRPRA